MRVNDSLYFFFHLDETWSMQHRNEARGYFFFLLLPPFLAVVSALLVDGCEA